MAGHKQLPIASMPTVEIPAELTTFEQVKAFIHQTISRREFSKSVGVGALGAIAFQMGCANDEKKDGETRQVYVANAKGMVVADTVACAGCRRCEAACVGFNKGKAQPSISNVKVNRNLNYGVNGVQDGLRVDGLYGNFRVVQDTCRQCPHPVPCQLACPNNAIEVTGPLNARIVNAEKCEGCGICVEACPWEMTALDGPVNGATTTCSKCTLCTELYEEATAAEQADWRPMCVEACITGALRYVAWQDRTDQVPPRHVVPADIQLAPGVKDTCKQCH